MSDGYHYSPLETLAHEKVHAWLKTGVHREWTVDTGYFRSSQTPMFTSPPNSSSDIIFSPSGDIGSPQYLNNQAVLIVESLKDKGIIARTLDPVVGEVKSIAIDTQQKDFASGLLKIEQETQTRIDQEANQTPDRLVLAALLQRVSKGKENGGQGR